MLISYNVEKLKKVILDFHHLTGISIAVYDTDFTPIVAGKSDQRTFFCNLIQSTPNGQRRCYASDNALLNRCVECGQAVVTHRCHAGLADTVVPIFQSGTLMGFIIFGQVCEKKESPASFSEIYECVKDLGLDYEALKQAYKSLTFFDRQKIDSAAEVISMLTKYIWLEKMIQPKFNSEFEKLLEYISTHLNEPLTVSLLCHKFNFSKNALYKNFHFHFNCTVNEYIAQKRLTHAERLLKTTSMPISEVCVQCGIDNYYYFCRLFKKEKGVTPLQYRKQFVPANTGNEYQKN